MSDTGGAGKGTREWRFYLDDMITFAEPAQEHVGDRDPAVAELFSDLQPGLD